MAAKYNPKTERHSWTRLRVHYYQCEWCALEKYKKQQDTASPNYGARGRAGQAWITKWRTRTGVITSSKTGAKQPVCTGPFDPTAEPVDVPTGPYEDAPLFDVGPDHV